MMNYSEKEQDKEEDNIHLRTVLTEQTADTFFLLLGDKEKDHSVIEDEEDAAASVKDDDERTIATTITNTAAAVGFSILVLLELAMSTISCYDDQKKPTNTNHKYLEHQQGSRLLALVVEQERSTTTTPTTHNQVVDEKQDAATIGIVANVYTAIAAVSILCNLFVLFLASRKKETDEESQQPIYQRIMGALAINAIIIETNCFIAGATGTMFSIMMLKSLFQDDMTIMTKVSESISFGCYIQAFIDAYFYFAYNFCCVWLCLYFLLKLKYGIARISKCAELSAYLFIFLIALANVRFMFMDGIVSPNPALGICTLFPQPDIYYVMFIPMLLIIFLLGGIFSMLLIIYKTFRDEQEINQVFAIHQEDIQSSSLGSFEATKDIAIQAFALVLFLFFAFFLEIFAFYQSGFVYKVIMAIVYLSQGFFLLTLYIWFEMRNVQKKYPLMSKIDAFFSVFTQDVDLEHRYNEEALSTEETPLMVDRKRCLVDMTLVEDDFCEGVLRDLDEIDKKVDRGNDEEEDKEIALQRQAKRKEEERIQALQAENMQMNGNAYVSIDDMEALQNVMCLSFDNMKQELADRKHEHDNSLRDSNVPPVQLRYGNIDPSTFRNKRPEEENLAFIREDEEEDTSEDEEYYAGVGPAPSTQQPKSGYTFISDLTSISTLRF